MFIFLTIVLIIVSIIVVVLFVRARQRKYDKFVLQNSVNLKTLIDINNRYEFNPYVSFDQFHTYDNEKFFDTISCQDYLIYQLQYMGKKVVTQINKIKDNSQRYSNYIDEVKAINDFGKFQIPIGNLNIDKLIKKEKEQLRKHLIAKPRQQLNITVVLCLSTLYGRVYSQKSSSFSESEILALIKRLNNKNGSFYNDREIWNALCRVERGKVSNKMRFAIYERDGYKCCKCGATERTDDLEIDHIIPIAKGGKSTYENLQTLCHRCNVEKGDSVGKNYRH